MTIQIRPDFAVHIGDVSLKRGDREFKEVLPVSARLVERLDGVPAEAAIEALLQAIVELELKVRLLLSDREGE